MTPSVPPRTTLAVPFAEGFVAWRECVLDFGDPSGMHGSGAWWVTDFAPDHRIFTEMLERAARLADTTTPPPEGLVHSDSLWITHGADIVGFLMLRHSLGNEFLRTEGGHVGYSVRPARRRRGHASRALGLAVARAAHLGIDRVLVTCAVTNTASARTIESQGGAFDGVVNGQRRYWIEAMGRST